MTNDFLKKDSDYELGIGEDLYLDTESGFGPFTGMIGYAGMVSENVFSLVYTYTPELCSNLYFPKFTKKIKASHGLEFEVLDVNPEKIKLKFLGKKE